MFENRELATEWYSPIDPQDYFDGMNVSIHGIDAAEVVGALTFAEVTTQLDELLTDRIVVTHTHFDHVAMHQSARHWAIPPVSCKWLDSALVARRTWDECAQRGYGLANVCKLIGHTFERHKALEDAKASGAVFLPR